MIKRKISSVLEKILAWEKYQGRGILNRYLNYIAWLFRTDNLTRVMKLWPQWNDYYDWYCLYFEQFNDLAPKHMIDYGGYRTGLPNGTAASLESLILFSDLIREDRFSVLNCGAGVSSFFLRKLHGNVVCCDPDEEYLMVVKKICEYNGLYTDNFVVGLDSAPAADYTYYDYGEIGCLAPSSSVRRNNFLVAVSKTRVLVYVDDADTRDVMKSFRHAVIEFSQTKGVHMNNASYGIDRFGRWGVILYLCDRSV